MKLIKSKLNFLNIYIFIVVTLAVFGIALISIYGYNYFSDRWYVNTFFNETDISRQSLEETIKQMKNTIAQYTLTVNAKNEQSFVIAGSDIDLYYDFEQLVNDEFENQHKKIILVLSSKKII